MRVDHALNGVRGGAGGGHVHHRVPAPTTVVRPTDRPTDTSQGAVSTATLLYAMLVSIRMYGNSL